jgi:phospholipase/lecithinase/hemolysin
MLIRYPLAALTAALMLVACGGGDPVAVTPVNTTAVKVAGDSLNDSGTFGIKFTVQTTPTAMIWTDRVAAAVGAPALCPRYIATSASTAALNPSAAACTSYGVGGGRVNPSGSAGDTTPFSVVQQLKDIAASGNYGAEELLLVDGGGNDVADLVGRYLLAGSGNPGAFNALVAERLSTVPTDLVVAGTDYMTALANELADAIEAEALANGAQRVVVITAPDVTVTPRFLAVLAGIAAGPGGATAATAVKNLANSWVVAFNTQLNSRFTGNNRVAVVDFYAELNSWISNPSAVGLTNTTTPACPVTGTDPLTNEPQYSISTCTDTLLNTAPFPAGETAPDWWQTYVFSDNFHGTPRTNQLMGELVTRTLEARGWK